MDRVNILAFLSKNKSYLEKQFGVKKIGLFGSYIRGEQTEKSDVDILVDMPEGFDRFFDLKYYLEKHLHKDVDLGKENNLRRFIRKRVANEIVYV